MDWNKRRFLAAGFALLALLGGCRTEDAEKGSRLPDALPHHTEKLLRLEPPDVDGIFSPFFAVREGDRLVAELTNVRLLSDKIAELNVENVDNYTICTFRIKEGLCFSDGVPLTADDAIFSFYALCDPSYTGLERIEAPIEGLSAYRCQLSKELEKYYGDTFDEIFDAGEASSPGDPLWAIVDEQWRADLAAAADYAAEHYADETETLFDIPPEALQTEHGLKTALAMALWGFGAAENGRLTGIFTGKTWSLSEGSFPTPTDYLEEIKYIYPSASDYDAAGESPIGASVRAAARQAYILTKCAENPPSDASAVPEITGIRRLSDRAFSVALAPNGDPDALDIPVAPLHYYGDLANYDFAEHRFGFPFGDLSGIKARSAQPLGAGPYIFHSFSPPAVLLASNEKYNAS